MRKRRTVTLSKRVNKGLEKLPEKVKMAFFTLAREIEERGPVRGNWPNYGKLASKTQHHCHIKKGRPIYVACWEEKDKEIEVYYVGTHEKAPY